MTQQYVGTKIITAWEQEKDGAPGYAVKYADGYTSWSPKGAFETAYIALGNIDHLPAHQQRVIAERAELDNKLEKLNAFCCSDIFDGLTQDEQDRLTSQSAAMQDYSNILHERVAEF